MSIKDRLFSGVFWIFFAVTCFTNLMVALILRGVTTLSDPHRKLNHLFSCLWGYSYVKCFPGWDTKVLNRHRIEWGKPYVLVANHTSLADIVLCFGLFRQFKWVSKKKNFSLPILGLNMRLCQYVPLVRGDRASIQEMLVECRSWLTRGISIMMFPEGTRSRDGNLLPFKPGAFALARQMNVPVVPIAIEGGHALVAKHSGTVSRKARLRVHVLEPVEPAGFDDDDRFANAVQARISDFLNQLPESASGG